LSSVGPYTLTKADPGREIKGLQYFKKIEKKREI
jgi:hypothetical protein